MHVTIEDIAKKVGKSITTVSRALHDYDDVSPETKAEVRRAALEMGYTPSSAATRLRKKRTDTLGLILPTFGPRFSDPFFSEFIAGIGNKARELGYDLLVSTHPPGEAELEAYRNSVQSRRVDGFVIVRTRREDARIDYLRQRGIQFVAFGRTQGELDYPFVDEDGEYGMHMLVDYLVKLGHRRIGCITSPDELNFSFYRQKGYRDGLAANGLDYDEETCRQGDLTQKSGYLRACELLDLDSPPTAIMAYNDLMALGAISAAMDRGLKVGEDISITGFDDIPMAEHTHPPLTTLHQPIYKIGLMVCDMLVQMVNQQALENHQVILQPELKIRKSSGPAPDASHRRNAG